jgi:MFS family permease
MSAPRVVAALCAAEILSMSAFAMFPAVQPVLAADWRLSNTATGWISGAYFFGYMLAVPVLTGLTDRRDARRVWVSAALLGAAAAAAFATLADGVWTAATCQFLAGVALAGTYMPGLKMLADRTSGQRQARFIAFYTTSFTIGSSISYYLVGALADAFSWRAAVLTAALGPTAAAAFVSSIIRPVNQVRDPAMAPGWPVDFRPVLRSRAAMGFVWAYIAHMWELFAMRAWLVPFLAFTHAAHGGPGGVRPTTVAAIIALLGVPASLIGNELSTRFDRIRVITMVMVAALGLSVATGLAAAGSWWLVVAACCAYGLAISADSAALTAGLVSSAAPGIRGASMALYSMLGFAGAFTGSLAVGGVLDLFGGQSTLAWTAAFVAMGLPGCWGLYVMRRAAAATV